MSVSKRLVVKVLAAAIVFVMLLGTLAGCSLKVDDPVVAKVGDIKIYASDYSQLFSSYYYYASYMGFDTSTTEGITAFQDWILETLISDKVVVYMAEKANVELTEEEIAEVNKDVQTSYDTQVATYKSKVDSSITGEDAILAEAEKLFIAALKDAGTSVDEYKKGLYDAYYEDALYKKYSEMVKSEATSDDDAAQKYYDEQLAEQKAAYDEDPAEYYTDYQSALNSSTGVVPFYVPAGYIRVKHILVKFDDEDKDGDTVDKAEYDKICEEIDTHLASGAYSFDELIEMYNDDDGMKNEPYKTEGYLVSEAIEDKYVDGFAEAALKLKNVGDVSPRIETEHGYHYIQLIEKVEPKTIAFDDVKEDINTKLLTEAQNKLFSERIDAWIKETPITRYESRIRYYGLQ